MGGGGHRWRDENAAAVGALVCGSPLPTLIHTHAKHLRAGLLAPPHHETVARFEDVQRARDARERHGAHKDGDVLGQAAGKGMTGKKFLVTALKLHPFSVWTWQEQHMEKHRTPSLISLKESIYT